VESKEATIVDVNQPEQRLIATPWKRNLAILWVAELMSIAGFSVVLPFLPFYVQELGITDTDAAAFWASLLTTTQAITMAIFSPIWGLLADRHGRKIMVERAMFGGAVVIAAMGFVQNVQQLVLLRTVQGALTGTVSAAITLVASSTPDEHRGYALGLLRMGIYLGSTVGPFLGGFVADWVGYRPTFWITGMLLLISGILVAALVREDFVPPEPAPAEGEEAKPRAWDGLIALFHSRVLMIVFGIRILIQMGTQVVAPFLPLFVQSIAAPDARIASLTGAMAGLASAASAVSSVVLGRISDKIGFKRILFFCSVAACLFHIPQAWAQTPTQLILLRMVSAAAVGGILASASALQATLANQENYGAVFGMDTSLMAGARALVPMFGTLLATSFGLPSVFLGAAALLGLAAAFIATSVPAASETSSSFHSGGQD